MADSQNRVNFTTLLVALDPVVFGVGGRFELEHRKDDFGTRSHGIIETLGPNRTKFYPLPQHRREIYPAPARRHTDQPVRA